jgi:hypothetical protein
MTNNPILFFREGMPKRRRASWLEEAAAAEMTALAREIATNDETIFDYVTGCELVAPFRPHIAVSNGAHYGESRWQALQGARLSNGYVILKVNFPGAKREHVTLTAWLDEDSPLEVVAGA